MIVKPVILRILDNKLLMDHSDVRPSTSKPIHLRRVERALNLNMFMQNVNNQLMLSSDSDDSGDDIPDINDANIENILRGMMLISQYKLVTLISFTESEPHSPKEYYNFKNVSSKRKWLADVLQENADSTPEDAQYKHIMRMHSYQKNLRKTKEVTKI